MQLPLYGPDGAFPLCVRADREWEGWRIQGDRRGQTLAWDGGKEGAHTDSGRQGNEQEGVKTKTITRGACVSVRLPGSVRLSVHWQCRAPAAPRAPAASQRQTARINPTGVVRDSLAEQRIEREEDAENGEGASICQIIIKWWITIPLLTICPPQPSLLEKKDGNGKRTLWPLKKRGFVPGSFYFPGFWLHTFY